MKKLIVSAMVALIAIAVAGCTCAREKEDTPVAPKEKFSETPGVKKVPALKLNPQQLQLNRQLFDAAVKQKLEEGGAVKPDRPTGESKPNPAPRPLVVPPPPPPPPPAPAPQPTPAK